VFVGSLGPFSRSGRLDRLNDVLSRRRGGVHVVLENVADPYNIAAILRTAEGMGVQHVHTIESVAPSGHVQHPPSRKVGRRALGNVAMGAARWLTVHHYRSPVDCCARLRELDLCILASDCPPSEADLDAGFGPLEPPEPSEFSARPMDASMTTPGRGVAVVFGNERRGVSRAFIERADHAFFLPMAGLTQSFNISVAAAMSLYALLATGHFPEGTLSDDERTELLGRWLLRDVRCAFCETQPCCTPCRGARSHSAPASRPRGR
jgi:tRNA (guanosine-2'-O-)-methyltransferase